MVGTFNFIEIYKFQIHSTPIPISIPVNVLNFTTSQIGTDPEFDWNESIFWLWFFLINELVLSFKLGRA